MAQLFSLCEDLGALSVDERLNYVFGQVLGVEDFRQEQLYLIHKNRVHNRALHGYGTVHGLAVTMGDQPGEALEVEVSPGLAVDPCGREITITALQCARLNAWLRTAAPGGAGGQVIADTLARDDAGRALAYVTLRYDACKTGDQPVFGDPCRSDSDAIQPTRVRDTFELDLRAAPPAQLEEDAIRGVGDVLGRVRITGGGGVGPDERQALLEQLRAALRDPGALAPDAVFELPQPQSRELLRDALRFWVTDLRPDLVAKDKDDERVLLAALRLTLNADKQVDARDNVIVDEAWRPYLLQTRLLQEWLLLGGKGEKGDPGTPGVSVTGASAETVDPPAGATATFDAATGNIHFQIPRGEKGDPGGGGGAGVVSASAETVDPPAGATAAFNPGTGNIHFQIPRGERGLRGLRGEKGDRGIVDRLFFSPSQMLLVKGDTRVTTLANLAGEFGAEAPPHPVWRLTAGTSLVFSTGWGLAWPLSPLLRLRYTAREDNEILWRIAWRWTRTIGPGEGEDPPFTSLGPKAFERADLPGKVIGIRDDELQLTSSEPFPLKALEDRPADHLLVQITLLRPDDPNFALGLLMAEIAAEG